MKLFKKRNRRPQAAPSQQVNPADDVDFYDISSGDRPIVADDDGVRRRTIHKTSRHGFATRREASNRATNRELLLLIFRTGAIVLALGVAFVGLKIFLGRFDVPTEEDIAEWDAEADVMDEIAVNAEAMVLDRATFDAGVVVPLVDRWREAERAMRTAEGLHRRGLSLEALESLDRVLRVAPDSTQAHRLILTIQLEQENYEAAVGAALVLLNQNSINLPVKMDLMRSLAAMNQAEECLVVANEMLQEDPNNLTILRTVAVLFHDSKDVDAAYPIYQQILALDESDVVALAGMSEIHLERREWETAIPYYLKLLDLNAQPEHYLALAQCYSQLEEAGKAIIFLGQASSLYGESEVSHWLVENFEFFDPVRETVEFRSFSDRVGAADTREAVAALRKREVEKKREAVSELKMPSAAGSALELKPGK